MRVLLCLAVALVAATTACGAPDELSRDEGRDLEIARDRIVASLELEAKLSSSDAAAERVVARVRRIVATGALEPEQLDEFGLASLGELRLVAPSLVIVDRMEIPRELDRPALRALLENATRDVEAATRLPADREVERIEQTLEDVGAERDTAIPVLDQTVGDYLDGLEGRLRPVWPDLARRLSD